MKKWILAIGGGFVLVVVIVALTMLRERETPPEQKIEQRIKKIQKTESSIVFLPPNERPGQWNDEKLYFVQRIVQAGRSYLIPKKERPILEEIFLPNDSYAPEWWKNDKFSKTAVLVVGRGIVLREKQYFSFQFTLILPGISVTDISSSSCLKKEEIAERTANSFLSASRPQTP